MLLPKYELFVRTQKTFNGSTITITTAVSFKVSIQSISKLSVLRRHQLNNTTGVGVVKSWMQQMISSIFDHKNVKKNQLDDFSDQHSSRLKSFDRKYSVCARKYLISVGSGASAMLIFYSSTFVIDLGG